MQPIKSPLTLVDSNEQFRGAFTLILDALDRFQVVSTHPTGISALKGLKKDRAELIVVGDLGDMNLEEFIGDVKDHNGLIKIIVLSAEFSSDYVFKLLSAGAIGLISRGSSYEEIIQSIDSALKGGAPMSSSVARMVVGFFQKNPHSPLSKRERSILQMQTKGKTYSEISRDLILSKETVKAHIKNIYLKLNVNRKSAAIEKALAEKYILNY
jgi:DNA-binding NarL/FixJ family response regulator